MERQNVHPYTESLFSVLFSGNYTVKFQGAEIKSLQQRKYHIIILYMPQMHEGLSIFTKSYL